MPLYPYFFTNFDFTIPKSLMAHRFDLTFGSRFPKVYIIEHIYFMCCSTTAKRIAHLQCIIVNYYDQCIFMFLKKSVIFKKFTITYIIKYLSITVVRFPKNQFSIFLFSPGPVYEFVCISFRTDNLNCFRAS